MNRDAFEYYQSFSQVVKDFCSPLKTYFGISFFAYAKVHIDGRYLLISNDKEFNDYYMENITYTNIFFRNHFNSKTSYETIVWPSEPLNLSMQACYDFNYWHGMNFILNKSSDVIELACFATSKDNPQIFEFYCKHALVLQKFVTKFKQKFSKEISVSPQDKRLARFSDRVDIYVPERKILDEQKIIRLFYQEIGINDENIKEKSFTSTELKVLKFISLGYTAKLTALELGVSPRTIESHLHKIKQKTAKNYKNDLVNLANQIFY